MKPKFSIVLIARNEEKTLPRLLKSLAEFMGLGGEVVLLDTGSTDATVAVAMLAGCRVEEVGDRFRKTISQRVAHQINDQFVAHGEPDVVTAGATYFDYASARNYAASLASNDWIFSPDADEILTAFNLDAINEAISDPEVDRLEYDFVYCHDQYGKPAIAFMHSKMYNRTKLIWRGIIHECLFPIV